MIRSKARFQSAGPKQNGCASFSGFEFAAGGFGLWLPSLEHAEGSWRDLDPAACSALSTAAIRSSINVPVCKRTNSLLLGFGRQGPTAKKIGGQSRFEPPSGVGEESRVPRLPVRFGCELPGSRLPAGLISFSSTH